MSINVDLFVYINQNLQNPILDMVMPIFTHLGDFVWALIIVLAIFLYAKLRNKDNLKRIAFIALMALLLSDLIVLILKHIVNEPRPFMTLDNVHLLIRETDPSFPSAHASSVWSVISIFIINIGCLVKKHRLIVISALIVFAFLMIFSRIYCGVHYPGDVLAGTLIGIFGALLINRYKDKFFSLVDRFF